MVLSGLPQCNENRLLDEGANAYFQKSRLMVENGPSNFVEAVEKLRRGPERGDERPLSPATMHSDDDDKFLGP